MEEEVELLFVVNDTGVGIPQTKLESIFERFVQADVSTVRRYGGTGLGLSITRSILQLMDSDIRVKSRENKGSTFSFSLKLKKGEADMLEQAVPVSTALHEEKIQHNALKLLVVEDAAINRLVLQQHLQDWWDVDAQEAMNGLEAVEKAGSETFDLILMDIRMPEMDGVEATRQIRSQNDHNVKMPIIALTADTRISNLREGEEHLFDALITKPFDPLRLHDTLTSLLFGEKAEKRDATKVSEQIHTYRPDFRNIQEQFITKEKIQAFLQTALATLEVFDQKYFSGIRHHDKKMLSDVLHKDKVLFHLLGMDAFHHHLSEVRHRYLNGSDTENLHQELEAIRTMLEQTRQEIRQYKA